MTELTTRSDARESIGWSIAYWICQVLGWGGYVAAGLAMVLPQTGLLPVVIGGYVLFFFYSIALTHLLRRQIRRREWLALAPGRAALRLFAAGLALGAILTALILVVRSVWTWTSPFNTRTDFIFSTWLSTTMATLVWVAIYTGVASMLRARRARQNAIALELDMREARLKALEAQIGPHFLFNSLNSLRGMITENPTVAQDMVTRLANILRHNLLRDSSPTETLGDQVALTTDYLALESVRFEERLRTRFDIDPATRSCAIPAMLLQTLVENAIKHGIAHLPDGGEIAITSRLENETLAITVENTGHLSPSPADSTRVGLKNLRERLRVLHGNDATLKVFESGSNTVLATVRI